MDKIDRLTIHTTKDVKERFQNLWSIWKGVMREKGKTKEETTQEKFLEKMLIYIEEIDRFKYILVSNELFSFFVKRTKDYFGLIVDPSHDEKAFWENALTVEKVKIALGKKK